MIKCCYYEKETKEKTMVLCTTQECPDLPGWTRIGAVNGSMIRFQSPDGIDTEFFKGEPVNGDFSRP